MRGEAGQGQAGVIERGAEPDRRPAGTEQQAIDDRLAGGQRQMVGAIDRRGELQHGLAEQAAVHVGQVEGCQQRAGGPGRRDVDAERRVVEVVVAAAEQVLDADAEPAIDHA